LRANPSITNATLKGTRVAIDYRHVVDTIEFRPGCHVPFKSPTTMFWSYTYSVFLIFNFEF